MLAKAIKRPIPESRTEEIDTTSYREEMQSHMDRVESKE